MKHQAQDDMKMHQSESEKIIAHLRNLLMRKADYPYLVDYLLSFEPPPRTATMGERRRILAATPTSYYSETITKNWSTRILIADREVYWQYEDGIVGSAFVRGQINRLAHSPDLWIREHGFVHNYSKEVDSDLIPSVRKFLLRANSFTVVDPTPTRRSIRLTNQHGRFEITLSESAIEIVRVPAVDQAKQIVFRYSHSSNLPPRSEDPRVAMRKRLSSAPQSSVHILPDNFTMSKALEIMTPGLDTVRVISVIQAREVARKYRYLFPTGTVTIRKATTYFGDLTLDVEDSGTPYSIGQAPVASRFPIPDNFVTQTRQYRNYKVDEIVDPGVRSRFLYYSTKDVMLIVSKPKAFRDAQLDKIISSFAPVDEPKQ